MSATRTTVVLAAGLAVLGIAPAARAADYAELLAKAAEARQHAAKAGRKLVPPDPPARPYAPSPAERTRGLVVYFPPMDEPFEGRPPAAGEVRATAEVRAARGETESLLLAVHALAGQQGLAWSSDGPMPAGIRCEFLPVVIAPMAPRRGDSYRMVGMWLADRGAVDVPEGQSRAWLVRLHVEADCKPGDYALRAGLLAVDGRTTGVEVTIALRVLPFGLADPWQRKYVFGAFCAGADFSDAQYAEMKAHGIEAILWFWGHYGLDIRNESGKLRVDFTDLDATIARMKKAGLRGPVVLGLGNDSCGHFERAVCQAFQLPMQPQVSRRGKEVKLAALNDPRIEQRMVEALRQLFDHAKAAQWPEVVILPYDEATERLMDEHRRMVRLFRKHLPGVRLYGVTMNRLAWAEMVLDTDILVANGDFARIRELATKNGKSAWFYGGATASHGYAGCRWRYGLKNYAHGADGAWFWCYNFHVDDPWNDFDGHTPDSSWVICWRPLRKPDASVETPAYEGLREAVDDVRYAMTLEAALARAGDSPAAAKVRTAYEKWRKDLQAADPKPAEVLRLRDQLIEWILALRNE